MFFLFLLRQGQKRRFWRTSGKYVVLLQSTFTCRPWCSLPGSWYLLTNCCLRWRLEDTRCSSSPKWCAAWTSWKTTSFRDGKDKILFKTLHALDTQDTDVLEVHEIVKTTVWTRREELSPCFLFKCSSASINLKRLDKLSLAIIGELGIAFRM